MLALPVPFFQANAQLLSFRSTIPSRSRFKLWEPDRPRSIPTLASITGAPDISNLTRLCKFVAHKVVFPWYCILRNA
jgi:hypothetical protein